MIAKFDIINVLVDILGVNNYILGVNNYVFGIKKVKDDGQTRCSKLFHMNCFSPGHGEN